MKPGVNSRRGRGRGNGKGRHGGSRTQQIDSSGPDTRIRGTPNQIFDRYQALAREAASAGDPVSAENYFQHAEHYYRILSANGMNGNAGPGTQNRDAAGNGQAPNGDETQSEPDNSDGGPTTVQ